MVDIPGNSTTTQSITVGGTLSDTLEVAGDRDWVRIELTAGQSIRVSLDGVTLEDPYLRIRDAAGNILYENDDISPGSNRDSMLAFTATNTGTYFIEVGAWEDNYVGTYELSVSVYTPPPFATLDQISDQLVTGFWGGEQQRFNVTQGGSLSVNLLALTPEGRQLARAALTTWTDIIGVNFVEVTSGGQITFDDNEDGAFSDSVVSGGFISSSIVNVSTEWLADYGTTLNSYSYQTYIHEIGHALGLGHAGNYNGEARYPFDARFQNDSVALSVMSYFDQQENTYFAGLGFTRSLVGTPMLADIVAMSRLYGLSATTRPGDTVYGFGSTAGNQVFDASLNLNLAFTIYDSGGIDTLNYSDAALPQRINLNAESFSNVGGGTGNVSIARGVVIENATGGGASDMLIGNSANNVLNGGDGYDTASYETASACVTVNLGVAGAQNTIAAGTDTLISIEGLVGSGFGDTLTGGAGLIAIRAGGGNDRLTPSADGDILYGEDGDDLFISGVGNDSFDGGDGFDTVDYGGASGAINAGPSTVAGAGSDNLTSIERILGSNFDDQLSFMPVMIGGAGNDVYDLSNGHLVAEAAGQGIDLVRSYIHYTLPENIENLSLHFDPYAGASVQPEAAINGTGNALDNLLTGSRGANQLNGLAGADTLAGREGIDTLTGGDGSDAFRDTAAGLDGDTITDFSASDRIIISNANLAGFTFSLSGSTLTFTGGSLTLSSVGGTLAASAAAGGGVQLSLQGAQDSGNDVLRGTANRDVLDGLGGADTIYGGAGDDVLSADRSIGFDNFADIDRLYGEDGNDSIFAGYGDIVDGGNGFDVVYVSYIGGNAGINGDTATLFAGQPLVAGGGTLANIESFATMALTRFNDTMVVGDQAGHTTVYAWEGDDTITGQNRSVTFHAGDGNDLLVGSIRDDVLYGDNGDDRVIGGVGADLLWGGEGRDRFFFVNLDLQDRIGDFEAGIDRIDLTAIDANAASSGDQAFTFIGGASFSGTAGELRAFRDTNDAYFIAGDVNGDRIADLMVEVDLPGLGSQLISTDFLL